MTMAEAIIATLQLQPHPLEGGYFRETYRSVERLPGDRSLKTAIYYLLTRAGVSEMHKLPGDEIYHWYAGDPLETLLLFPDGRAEFVLLGNDIMAGQRPQLVIPGGVWQGSVRREAGHGFVLIGATMSPGYHPADYERGQRDVLTANWPTLNAAIAARTPHG